MGSLADGDIRHLADPQGPPRRCPPPEKGTKGVGLGSSEICCAWASAGFGPGPSARPAPEVPASSWRLTSPRLSPAESKGSSGLPAACSADREGVGLAGLLLRETPGSCVMAGSHRLMANLMMALPPVRPRDSSVVLCKAALPVTSSLMYTQTGLASHGCSRHALV